MPFKNLFSLSISANLVFSWLLLLVLYIKKHIFCCAYMLFMFIDILNFSSSFLSFLLSLKWICVCLILFYRPALLAAAENFTVLIKNNIRFPTFNYTRWVHLPRNPHTRFRNAKFFKVHKLELFTKCRILCYCVVNISGGTFSQRWAPPTWRAVTE